MPTLRLRDTSENCSTRPLQNENDDHAVEAGEHRVNRRARHQHERALRRREREEDRQKEPRPLHQIRNHPNRDDDSRDRPRSRTSIPSAAGL
jgi:hypothetical protein